MKLPIIHIGIALKIGTFKRGIPLPGTGAWTGSLIAALLNIDFKKAIAPPIPNDRNWSHFCFYTLSVFLPRSESRMTMPEMLQNSIEKKVSFF